LNSRTIGGGIAPRLARRWTHQDGARARCSTHRPRGLPNHSPYTNHSPSTARSLRQSRRWASPASPLSASLSSATTRSALTAACPPVWFSTSSSGAGRRSRCTLTRSQRASRSCAMVSTRSRCSRCWWPRRCAEPPAANPPRLCSATRRLSRAAAALASSVLTRLCVAVAQVCAGVYPDVTTCELDDLAAETAAYMSTGACSGPPDISATAEPAARDRQWSSGSLVARQARGERGRLRSSGGSLAVTEPPGWPPPPDSAAQGRTAVAPFSSASRSPQSDYSLTSSHPRRTQTTRNTRCWRRALPCPTCTSRPRRGSLR
jgi:hypothetical protein